MQRDEVSGTAHNQNKIIDFLEAYKTQSISITIIHPPFFVNLCYELKKLR